MLAKSVDECTTVHVYAVSIHLEKCNARRCSAVLRRSIWLGRESKVSGQIWNRVSHKSHPILGCAFRG